MTAREHALRASHLMEELDLQRRVKVNIYAERQSQVLAAQAHAAAALALLGTDPERGIVVFARESTR